MFPSPSSASGPAPTAAVLAIGDEVLRGEVTNGNAAFLSARLFELGFVPREHAVVSDDPADIRGALLRFRDQVDVLVATGGLGPTDDDRTIDVLCALLSVEATTYEPALDAMKRRFERLNFQLTPNNLRQVRFPVGGEALPNPVGIAPGFCVRLGGTEAYFLPGVPREMEAIFNGSIAPRLEALLASRVRAGEAVRPAVRTFHVFGMGESHIDHRLAGLLEGVADTTLHFRTAAPENHVKLVVRGRDDAQNRATLDRLSEEVRRRLGRAIYGVDSDRLAAATLRALRAAKATLAFAESCTGGYAGQAITSEPGSSDVFRGAIVAYANDVKVKLLGVRPETLEAHGAVSEACAAEMAEGARRALDATVAVSITGIAGAELGAGSAPAPQASMSEVPWPPDPTNVPPSKASNATNAANATKSVGTVCFGVAGPRGGRTETRQLAPGRERIRRAAAYYALDLARRYFE